MEQITIDLDDYLSQDEKHQIVRESFRAVAAQTSKKDFERILTNGAYDLARKEVDAVFDGGMVEYVKEKATDVIKGLGSFTVFKKPDAWDAEASKGWVHLQRAMDDAAPLIHARVQQIVSEISYDDLRDMIESQIADAIIAKLTARATP